MDLLEQFKGMLSEDMVRQMSGKLGVNEQQVRDAIEVAVPAMTHGMAQKAQSADGADAIAKMFNQADLPDDVDAIMNKINRQEGRPAGGDPMMDIFGDRNEAVNQGIQAASGMKSTAVNGLMGMLAPMIIGMIGKSVLGKMTGGGKAAGSATGGPSLNPMDIINAITKSSSTMQQKDPQKFSLLTSLLDRNKDGRVMDDIVRMFTGFLGGKK